MFLGIALLAAVLLAGHWFVNANPKSVAGSLKWVLFGIIGLIGLVLILSGKFFLALWLLPALLPWLMRMRQAANTAKAFSRMSGGGSGQTSEVESAYLQMRLYHDSGEMDGTVKKGTFAGASLSTLSRADLLSLYDECVRHDGESARLMAAYLDRTHADWRDEAGEVHPGDEDRPPPPPGDAMRRDEALKVLGLEAGASIDEIKAAHHRLIAGLHPDKGGSAYLAAKINEARDILLGK